MKYSSMRNLNAFSNTFSKKYRGIGIIILLIYIAAAFIGYVLLSWEQISYWGVITNLLLAILYIGDTIVLWIWGRFSINNATLNRLHFILPLVIFLFHSIYSNSSFICSTFNGIIKPL